MLVLNMGLSLAAALAFQTTSGQASSPPAAPPPSCVSAEHRQFDFWIGRWNVYRSSDNQLVGRNVIERLYGGCVIRESWTPLNGTGGSSFNSYLPDQRIWRQIWVDSGNSWAVFDGRLEGQTMVLTGVWAGAQGPGTRPLVRTRWRRAADGSVRQFAEASVDQGQTWSAFFDFTYRPDASSGG